MSVSSIISTPEWTLQYQQYLAQAAKNAAAIRDLYREVIDRIADGELSPRALDEALPPFMQGNGAALANDLADISVRYLARLIDTGSEFAYELVERLLPGAVVRPDVPLPRLDATDWSAAIGRLAEYANRHSIAQFEMMQSVMQRVAAGDLTPAELQAGSAEFTNDRAAVGVLESVQFYFDLLRGLDEVSSDFALRYLRSVLGDDRHDAFGLSLRGAIGGVVVVRLAVTNTQIADATVRCVLTDLRRADGVGPAFVPDATITPERFVLEPGQERVVTLSMLLTREQFEPDRLYVGTLHVMAPAETLMSAPVEVQPFASPTGTPALDRSGS